ncbi:MAG: hypothetical protein J0L67_04275 [Cytophagales bacterium]|nr:hypothetical protein [Cytophagales bacterium]
MILKTNTTRFLLMLVCMLCSQCLISNAQVPTYDELFRQKQTQRKYLARQIALLKLYLGYVKKGYDIASKGLNTIHNIKNGDMNLHRDFFGSLKNVNPHIANSAKVADIIAFQVYLISDLKKINRYCTGNMHFTPEEIRYVAAVYHNMLFLLDACVSELFSIVRPQEGYQMKDDERLARMDTLYTDMLDKHTFVQAFTQEIYTLAAEREREQHHLDLIRTQHQLL